MNSDNPTDPWYPKNLPKRRPISPDVELKIWAFIRHVKAGTQPPKDVMQAVADGVEAYLNGKTPWSEGKTGARPRIQKIPTRRQWLAAAILAGVTGDKLAIGDYLIGRQRDEKTLRTWVKEGNALIESFIWAISPPTATDQPPPQHDLLERWAVQSTLSLEVVAAFDWILDRVELPIPAKRLSDAQLDKLRLDRHFYADFRK